MGENSAITSKNYLSLYVKSIFFGDKIEKLADTDADKTKNAEIKSTPFAEEIFAETTAALNIIGVGTEKVARTATIDETNPYLRQGNDDHWDSYDQKAILDRKNINGWITRTKTSLAVQKLKLSRRKRR